MVRAFPLVVLKLNKKENMKRYRPSIPENTKIQIHEQGKLSTPNNTVLLFFLIQAYDLYCLVVDWQVTDKSLWLC